MWPHTACCTTLERREDSGHGHWGGCSTLTKRATGIFKIYMEQTGAQSLKGSSQRCTHSNAAWRSGYLPRRAEGLSRPCWI